MKIENIADSISYVDLLNKIDNMIFRLLYDPKEGYNSLKSKKAIDKINIYYETFENEISQLIQENNLDELEALLKEKRIEFSTKIKEHYMKQCDIWAEEVFTNLIDNSVFWAYANKNNNKMLDKIYNRALCAISWISNIKNYNEEIKQKILNNFEKDFKKAISSNYENYIKKPLQKSDYDCFINLYFMVSEKEELFYCKNLEEFNSKLTKKDIQFLSNIQSKLKSFKKTEIIDEINLIKESFNILNTKDNKTKYDLLYKIYDDFKNFYSTNKKLDEEDKIKIIKRRMDIFNSNKDNYFKKKLM